MAAVTICSDFGAQENKICHRFHFFPHLLAMKWWDWMPWSQFFECWLVIRFFILVFHPHQELFSSLSLSAFGVVSSTYLRLLIFLLAVLIPAWTSSSTAFGLMYSAYKLNKQVDNIWPWHFPFPILNQSSVPCPVLTVASCPAYRLLKRQVRLSDIPISNNFPKLFLKP